MLAGTLILEDTILHFIRDVRPEPDSNGADGWTVTISDCQSGRSATVEWSDTQLAAVLAVALGGDDVTDFRTRLATIADDACKNLPLEVRPIP